MKIKFILALSVLPFLMACSKQDSEKVKINFIPDNPKVKKVNGKLVTGVDASTGLPVYTEIKAPWFKFRASIVNGSDKNLVVNSFQLKMTGLSLATGVVTAESVLTAESFIPGSIVGVEVPTVLAAVTAGVTQEMLFDFYVQNLPVEVSSGVFNVEVLAEGWFGTEDDPTSYFTQKYFFTTR